MKPFSNDYSRFKKSPTDELIFLSEKYNISDPIGNIVEYYRIEKDNKTEDSGNITI